MERMNIGIVGLKFGSTLIRRLQEGGGNGYFDIKAVCDLDQEKARAMSQKLGVKAYFDLDRLLEDDSIPVIGLFTPPAGRSELVRKVIRAGRDVMTTKPFDLDPDAALDVLREARHRGRVVHLNSPSPVCSEDLRKVREWVVKYRLGRPIACRYESWIPKREKADGRWHDDPGLCPVAPVFRLGIYSINDAIRLFGDVDKVCVLHSRVFTGRPTPDNAQLGMLFKNGALGNVFSSFCTTDGETSAGSFVLNYENGTVFHRREKGGVNRMWVAAGGKEMQSVADQAVVRQISGDYLWDVFYNAIKGERPKDEISPEEIVKGLRVITAMSRAEKSGRIEAV